MKAMDVMVRDVVTVKPETDVASAIKLLIEHDISALPVVDDGGKVVGVISEADLVRRTEIGTEKQRPWWLEALTPGSLLAEEFSKSHGRTVGEVMSPHVVSAPAVASLVPHLGAVLCLRAISHRALDGGLAESQDSHHSDYRGRNR